MWVTYFPCWFACVVFLIVPGLLIARGLRADLATSLMVAPLVSFAAIGVVDIVYGMCGIECNWMTVLAPPIVFGAALLAVEKLRKVETAKVLSVSDELLGTIRIGRLSLSKIALALALAVLTGTAMSAIVWVSGLKTSTAFIQMYDNAWHLWRIANFMETGNHSSVFVGGTLLGGGFYPSAWHGLAALAGSMVGCGVPIAEGASLMATISVAYPLSCVFLLTTLFGDNPRRVVLGSIFCLSIAFFPWRIMLWGPLYPNVVSFAVMPAEAALFIRLLRDAKGAWERTLVGTLFVLGGISLALIQPNAIFSCGVFLIPFCLAWCRQVVSERKGIRGGIIAEVVLLLIFAAIWLGLAFAPFMRQFVWYEREMNGSVVQAIKWALALCFIMRRQQYGAGLLVLIGGACLFADKKRRWVVASYAFLIALYLVAYSVPAPLKNILTGFWYADHWRLATAASVFAIPLIACGADALFGFAERVIEKRQSARQTTATKAPTRTRSCMPQIVAASLVGFVLVYNYVPLSFVPGFMRCYAFDTVKHNVYTTINYDLYEWAPLKEEEDKFLAKVKDIVGDAKVINQPFDGSVFAYPLYGIDVLYPFYGSGVENRAPDLRKSLDKIAGDEKLVEQAHEYGVTYLLQLDQGDAKRTGMSEDASYLDLGYSKKNWVGVNAVRDDTPGFELLLSEGDMRLYRIVAD